MSIISQKLVISFCPTGIRFARHGKKKLMPMVNINITPAIMPTVRKVFSILSGELNGCISCSRVGIGRERNRRSQSPIEAKDRAVIF